MGMRLKDSKFGAPVGVYKAKFIGMYPMKQEAGKPRIGTDGKPMGPAVEWQFEIIEATEDVPVGQLVGRITAAEPTARNSCGMILSGIIGRPLTKDDDLEPAMWANKLYQVVIGTSKDDPNKTQVVQVIPLKAAANGQPQAQAAPPSTPRPPTTSAPKPPPRPAAKQSESVPEPMYWVTTTDGEEPELVTGDQIRAMLKAKKINATDEIVMDETQQSGWKSATHFGLNVGGPPF